MSFHFLHPVRQPAQRVTYVTIACTGWVDVADDSLRGSHTAYEIECTVQGPDGLVLHTREEHRRFREWRKLHLKLFPKSKFPESKAIAHGEALKAKRAEALENWLQFAFAQAPRVDGSPPAALLRFVGMTEWPATGIVGLIALPQPAPKPTPPRVTPPSRQTASLETPPHPQQPGSAADSSAAASSTSAPLPPLTSPAPQHSRGSLAPSAAHCLPPAVAPASAAGSAAGPAAPATAGTPCGAAAGPSATAHPAPAAAQVLRQRAASSAVAAARPAAAAAATNGGSSAANGGACGSEAAAAAKRTSAPADLLSPALSAALSEHRGGAAEQRVRARRQRWKDVQDLSAGRERRTFYQGSWLEWLERSAPLWMLRSSHRLHSEMLERHTRIARLLPRRGLLPRAWARAARLNARIRRLAGSVRRPRLLRLPPLVALAVCSSFLLSNVDALVLLLLGRHLGLAALLPLLSALLTATSLHVLFGAASGSPLTPAGGGGEGAGAIAAAAGVGDGAADGESPAAGLWLRRAAGRRAQLSSAAACLSSSGRPIACATLPLLSAWRGGGAEDQWLIASLVLSLIVREAAQASELARWARLGTKLARGADDEMRTHRRVGLAGSSSAGSLTSPSASPSASRALTHEELARRSAMEAAARQQRAAASATAAAAMERAAAEASELEADGWMVLDDGLSGAPPQSLQNGGRASTARRGSRVRNAAPPAASPMSRPSPLLTPATPVPTAPLPSERLPSSVLPQPAIAQPISLRHSVGSLPPRHPPIDVGGAPAPHACSSDGRSRGASLPSRPSAEASALHTADPHAAAAAASHPTSRHSTRAPSPTPDASGVARAGADVPALVSPLLSAAQRLLLCLPHELRALVRPILTELLAAGAAKSVVGFEHLRGLIQAVGAAASLVLSRALLDPDGRMRLWLGMKALADSAEMDGRLPEIISAFTKQRHAFALGLRGSIVIQEGLQAESDVPLHRLFTPGPEPPEPLERVAVGDSVRVRFPYKREKVGREGSNMPPPCPCMYARVHPPMGMAHAHPPMCMAWAWHVYRSSSRRPSSSPR